MKICFISNLYPPYQVGGAEVYVKTIAEELAKKGNEIIVITTSPSNKDYAEKINGVKILRIAIPNIYPMYAHTKSNIFLKPLWHLIDIWNPFAYLKIKKILKNEKPDIVHIHNYKGFSLSVFDAVNSLKIHFLFTLHDYSLICPKANLLNRKEEICNKPSILCKFYRILQRRLLNDKVKLVLAPSQFVLDFLHKEGFFKNSKRVKLPLGIKIRKKKIKKDYNIIDILFVGNVSKHKGVHILIKAFKKIKEKKVRLHIVGKGKDLEYFKKLAGNDKRIKFYGFVDKKTLDKLYEKANIVVVPSIWYDNSPVVIYEALQNGCIVIGSRIGGLPELIKENVNGFLFPAGNSKALKNKLEKLIKNKEKLKKIEKNSFSLSWEYDLNKHVENLINMYEKGNYIYNATKQNRWQR